MIRLCASAEVVVPAVPAGITCRANIRPDGSGWASVTKPYDCA